MSVSLSHEPGTSSPLRVSSRDLCSVCRTLHKAQVYSVTHLSNAAALAERKQCSLCALVLGMLSPDCGSTIYLQKTSRHYNVFAGSRIVGSLLYFTNARLEKTKKKNKKDKLEVKKEADDEWRHAVGRVFAEVRGTSPMLDYTQIHRWLAECERGHICEDELVASGKRGRWLETFFVDVLEGKLVSLPVRGTRFVALSYVRGNVAVFEARGENLEMLQRQGALLPKSGCAVSRVVVDAMALVRRIGERYLWVDALCIPQDGGSHKAEMIGAMDLVYSLATLTVIAASGDDADCPLAGVSQARSVQSETAWVEVENEG